MSARMGPGRALRGDFSIEADGVRGYACDADDPTRRLAVELLVDGWPTDLARADDFAPEASAIGDGCCGFGFRLSQAVLDGGGLIEVRVANTGEPVGGSARIVGAGRGAPPAACGRLDWAGGLRLTGWVEPAALGENAKVRLVVERRTVAEGEARAFAAVKQGALRRTKARFDLRLPDAFADGRVHLVTALDEQGRELAGSPCAVLCFADGLRDALLRAGHLADGDPRVEMLDRLLPRSVPFAELGAWLARHGASDRGEARSDAGSGGGVAVLMLGEASDATLASLEGQVDAPWLAVAAPETGGPATFDPAACHAALAAEPHLGAVVVLPAGSRLGSRALTTLAASAQAAGGPVYPDALVETADGDLPLLWPAYDAARQREQGYAALAFAAPAALVSAALGRGASSAFALFDRLAAERTPAHQPEILVALPPLHPELGVALAAAGRGGVAGAAWPAAPDRRTGLPVVRLRPARRGAPGAVAVVQPAPGVPDLSRVAAALPDVGERLVVSHRPLPLPAGWRNVVVAGGRNPSLLRAAALREVGAAHCLLLDAGVEPRDAEAGAEAMAMFADGVVAVGGLVLDEDGLVLSAGLVLGPGFGTAPAFAGLDPDAGGYAGALSVARGCGALDAAALVVDRAAAADAGGFDAALFPEHQGCTDLCLKLRARGGRLVVTPRARFVRTGMPRATEKREGAGAELAALRRRWGQDLLDDPHYHPALNLDDAPFTGLAWPPRPRLPRTGRTPEPARPTLDFDEMQP